MILRELLLEDEHVVHVGEDSMEVRRQQVRLHLFEHLRVASIVQLLDLGFGNPGELPLTRRLAIVDVLDVLHLEQEGHVRVQATLL